MLILSVTLFSSCEEKRGEAELETARELSAGKPSEALDQYKRIVQVNQQDPVSIKAALEAANLCLKENVCGDNEEFFLKHIIKKSENNKEQIQAQKRLAEFYYDKGFFSQAIDEMNRLLSKESFKEGRSEIKIKLAKANFYIKNFYQAEVELNSYIKEVTEDQEKFLGFLLKADIQTANKKYLEAMTTYKDIKQEYRDLYFKNQVYMNEVLLLEEQKLIDQAVTILESVKLEAQALPGTEFIDSKIERLKERKALMPGASGLKR